VPIPTNMFGQGLANVIGGLGAAQQSATTQQFQNDIMFQQATSVEIGRMQRGSSYDKTPSKKTFKEELQSDTDKWLSDVKL